MHPLQAGERTGRAQARVFAGATALVKRLNLSADLVSALTVQQRDPMIKRISEIEATADLLEAVLAATPVEAAKKDK